MRTLVDDEKARALVECDRVEGCIEEQFLQARTPRDVFELAQQAQADATARERRAHVDRLDLVFAPSPRPRLDAVGAGPVHAASDDSSIDHEEPPFGRQV